MSVESSSTKTEPRQPILAEQRIGRMTPTGLKGATEVYVLDWDHEWWMLTWCWQKLKVRRNLLLTSASGSSKLDSSSQATAEEQNDG